MFRRGRAPRLKTPAWIQVDALALPVSSDRRLEGVGATLNEQLDGILAEALETGEFRCEPYEVMSIRTDGRIAAKRVLLYGVGPREHLEGARVRWLHLSLAATARRFGYRSVGIVCHGGLADVPQAAVVEGCVMGCWDRSARKSKVTAEDIEELILVGFDPEYRAHDAAQELGEATNEVRRLQDTPANEMGPDMLVNLARNCRQAWP